MYFFFFFFNDTATTEIYTLSLHDALPISELLKKRSEVSSDYTDALNQYGPNFPKEQRLQAQRSEEHTSELQSPCNLVCRLLLEKKKNKINIMIGISYVRNL